MGPSFRNAILAASLLSPAAFAADEPAVRPAVRYRPSLLVQLQVSDLERSIRFYRDTLGFEVTERRDDLQFVQLSCGLQGLQVGLSAGGAAPPQPGTVTLNFGVRATSRRRAARWRRGGSSSWVRRR